MHCTQVELGSGLSRVTAVLSPAEVQEWQKQFQSPQAMWDLALELMEATQGWSPWVSELGNAIGLEWEVRGALGEWPLLVPTPGGVEAVRTLVDDVPVGVADRNAYVGGGGWRRSTGRRTGRA